jgi:hypothetical protein
MSEPDEEGGDPACWLSRVCANCGQLTEGELPAVCATCGHRVPAEEE